MEIFAGRGFSRAGLRTVAIALFLLGLGSGVGRTQRSGTMQQPTLPTDPVGQVPDATGTRPGPDDPLRNVAARQAKLREVERQKRLEADTEKLLTLATQLHDDVVKTNKNILSLDVVKRADEIEKLAHNVKERMKD